MEINHPDFQGFKNLCANNPKVSVKLAGDEWTEFVASTKSSFGIGRKRNIVKMEFDGKEYLIASGKGCNGQMTGSGKFIPEEFVLDIDKGQRVFAPSISTRHLDTESLGLEYFAKLKNAVKGGKYPKITGKVKIASDLCPCPSCSAIFQQFSDMFPNVTIDITTTTKLHY
ncbi:deaminase domain-containing protein [Aquimarina agarivorans]|uniref:deaminase domain-containing protein n=1 Tax=Aquimarina agarivorans TaxID=980584 RepID=UPI000248F90E|nr:deaminase domain-containing protein [Aquimarina agarivorans]